MELAFVILGAAILGIIARYSLPHRELVGALLLPLTTAAAAAIVWELLTWAGMKPSSPWIWIITFAIAIIKAFGAELWLVRRRLKADAQALASR